MTRLEQPHCEREILDSNVRKGIVPHGFHKLTVAFSSISPSQYGYFHVGILFTAILHDA